MGSPTFGTVLGKAEAPSGRNEPHHVGLTADGKGNTVQKCLSNLFNVLFGVTVVTQPCFGGLLQDVLPGGH